MLAAVPLVLVGMDQPTLLTLCKSPPLAVEVQGRVPMRQSQGMVATPETDRPLVAALSEVIPLLLQEALVASRVLPILLTELRFLTHSAASAAAVEDMRLMQSDNLEAMDLLQAEAAEAALGLIMGSTAAPVEMAGMEP